MPYRKESFTNGCFYHIVSRRVDGQPLFIDDRDRWRFLFAALLANVSKPRQPHHATNWNNKRIEAALNEKQSLPEEWLQGKPLVDIEVFALMDSHYHFLLRQNADAGIQMFTHRLNNAYANYFNKRHERKGALFEGPFRSVRVKTDRHLRYVFGYIHLNPLDRKGIEWRKVRLRSWSVARGILQEYPWSSFHDFVGKRRFGALLCDGTMRRLFPNAQNVLRHLQSWIPMSTPGVDMGG